MKIFISAYPRSGTTFVAKQLVTDLGFFSSPESHFMFDLHAALRESPKVLEKHKVQKVLKKSFKFRSWELHNLEYKDLTLNSLQDFYVHLISEFNNVSEADVSAGITLDHTPENMLNTDYIVDSYDDYFFIRLVRDPRAVYSSIKNVKWGQNTPISFIKSWEKYEKNWQEKAKKIPKERVFEIKYENFINNKTKIIEEFTSLLPIYRRAKDSSFKLPNYTKKQHKLVCSNSLDQSRINAWKQSVTNKELRLISSSQLLQQFLALHKYEKPLTPISISSFDHIEDFTKNNLKKIFNKTHRLIIERRP